MRYALAFLCLIPFVLFNSKQRTALKNLSSRDWLNLSLLGVAPYTLTQSLMYVSLGTLPSAMVSLALNPTSVFIAISGMFLLKERPSSLQWTGLGISAVGLGGYFLPIALERGQGIGLAFAAACMAGNVASGLFGRKVNRGQSLPPLVVTFVSKGVGAALMLVIGGTTQGFGHPTGADWLIIAWLAVVNTAVTFTLWNVTLRTLTAVESSILNSLMLLQIAVLSLLFLGETLSGKDLLGLALVFAGVIVAQVRRREKGIVRIDKEDRKTS